MSRKQKDVVSYFPHDANASTSDTLAVLQSQFGNDGYAFWFKLLEKLATTEGHCVDCRNPIKWQLLLVKTGVNELTGVEILKLLVEMQAIDKELWALRLIWCQNLVENLSEVYKNRRRELPQKPKSIGGYCIVCGKTIVDKYSNAKYCSNNCRQKASRSQQGVTPKYPKNSLITDIKAITTGDNSKKTIVMPQSRVEYSRVEKSKDDGGKKPQVSLWASETLYLGKVDMAWWQALTAEYSNLDPSQELKAFGDFWHMGKRPPPKNLCLALRNWFKKAREIKARGNGAKGKMATPDEITKGWG